MKGCRPLKVVFTFSYMKRVPRLIRELLVTSWTVLRHGSGEESTVTIKLRNRNAREITGIHLPIS